MPSKETVGAVERQLEHSVPGAFALQVVRLLSRWDVAAQELLAPLGLVEVELEAPATRLPIGTFVALLERARHLTGEPALGIYLGLEKRATLFGYVGFAAMHASTLREALELAVQFAPAVTTSFASRLRIERGVASLIVEEQCDLGSVRDVALLSFMVGLSTLGDALTGRELSMSIDLAFPEPAYCARFAKVIPNVRFSAPINQVWGAAPGLDLPLATPDRAAMRLARERCEQQMLELGLIGNVVDRTRRLMLRPSGPRSFEEVAVHLHMSQRTLKRRLAEQGVSFTTLRERALCERAVVLLQSRELTLDGIAAELGYATVAGFTRAFRRWTDVTPSAFRRKRAS